MLRFVKSFIKLLKPAESGITAVIHINMVTSKIHHKYNVLIIMIKLQ
jgi:hypothetical protein